MNIKKSTLNSYKRQVEMYIANNNFNAALDLAAKYPLIKGYTICQTKALSEFKVKKDNLLNVYHVQKENPYYSSASGMRLFLVAELETLFERRQKKVKKKSFDSN